MGILGGNNYRGFSVREKRIRNKYASLAILSFILTIIISVQCARYYSLQKEYQKKISILKEKNDSLSLIKK